MIVLILLFMSSYVWAAIPNYLGTPESLPRAGASATLSAGIPDDRWVSWDFGQLFGHEKFEDIQNIQLETDSATGTSLSGSPDTQYDDLWISFVSAKTRIPLAGLGIGLDLALPMRSFATIDTQDPFRPEYSIYQSQTTRPEISLFLHKNWHRFWSTHLVSYWGFGGEGHSKIQLVPDGSGKRSSYQTLRFKSKIRPTIGIGINYQSRHVRLGFRYREKQTAKMRYGSETNFVITGTNTSLPINFEGVSTLIFEPRRAAIGAEWGEIWVLGVEGEWIQWSSYQPPYLKLAFSGELSKDFRSNYPSHEFRDEWLPKVFLSRNMGRFLGTLGYAFHRSILKSSLTTSDGNFLDPDRHIFSAGLKQRLDQWGWNTGMAYHHAPSTRVNKDPSRIGAPGFSMGGRVLLATIGVNL